MIEIIGYTGDNPQKDFGGKVYDHGDRDAVGSAASAGTSHWTTRLDALEQRVKALEARKK